MSAPDEFPSHDKVPLPEDAAKPEANAKKDALLRQILEPAARSRLGNVKMVKPELADAVENYLIGMGMQGRLRTPITDEQLKQILLSSQQPKRDFKINRI